MKRLLLKSRFTANHAEIAGWALEYHGEMQGGQIMIDLAAWSLLRPKEFLRVITAVPAQSRPDFIRRYAFALHDAGMTARFCTEFAKQPEFSAVVTELAKFGGCTNGT